MYLLSFYCILKQDRRFYKLNFKLQWYQGRDWKVLYLMCTLVTINPNRAWELEITSKHCEKPKKNFFDFLKVHNELGKVTKFWPSRPLFSWRNSHLKKVLADSGPPRLIGLTAHYMGWMRKEKTKFYWKKTYKIIPKNEF